MILEGVQRRYGERTRRARREGKEDWIWMKMAERNAKEKVVGFKSREMKEND